MLAYGTAYLATALIFLAIDAVWLGYVAKRFYFERLGHLLLEKPLLGTAAAFYVIYMIGVLVFAVAPGLEAGNPVVAAGYGALFGLCAYATYDITNYVTLRDWPLEVSIVDTIWGAVLTSVSAGLGTWLTLAMLGAV